jgi:hypothetical protein
MIHLKEDDDQRTVVTIRKRNSYRSAIDNGFDDVSSTLTFLLYNFILCLINTFKHKPHYYKYPKVTKCLLQ